MRRVLALLLLPAAALVSSPAEAASPVPHVLVSGVVGSARQVVLVSSPSPASTYARLSWWSRHPDGSWHLSRAEVTVRVGVNGMTTAKREGDGKTPIGVFPAGIAFGWYSSPGTHLAWRTADSASRWVDDSGSAYYNRWMQAPADGRWDSAEHLRITPYVYALQIGYNLTRTPGKGSAIFLHVTTGRATSGCVSADRTTVISTIKWLTPTAHPVLVIGTRDWIAGH